MLTNVNVTPLPSSTNGTLGLASVTVDNAVVINSIAIKQNSKTGELYLQMPQKFNKSKGQYEDVAFPITSAARDELNKKVFDKFTNPNLDMDIRNAVNTEPKIEANIAKYARPEQRENSEKIGAGTLTINDSFVVKNVNVYSSDKGMFWKMPEYKALSGTSDHPEFKSIVAPASKEMHKQISQAVKTEINTDYAYRMVNNETFKKLRETCPDLFKQCGGSENAKVKIKFDKANKEQMNQMLGTLSTQSVQQASQSQPKPMQNITRPQAAPKPMR